MSLVYLTPNNGLGLRAIPFEILRGGQGEDITDPDETDGELM